MKIKIGIVLLVLLYFIQDGCKMLQWTVKDVAGTYSMKVLRYWGLSNINLQGKLFFYEDSTAIVAGGSIGPVKGEWHIHNNAICYCIADAAQDGVNYYIAMKIVKNGSWGHGHVTKMNRMDPDGFVDNNVLYIKTGNLSADSIYKTMGIVY